MKWGGNEQLEWELTEEVLAACIEVHRCLGPGLLEKVYEECLAAELEHRGLKFVRQKPLQVRYRGVYVPCAYELDLVVEDRVILELKAVERLIPVFEAQLLSYLRLSGIEVGLLINFHTTMLRQGIRRLTLRRAPHIT